MKNSQSFGQTPAMEEMRLINSSTKLDPKNLDEKSAGSSSVDHLNAIIMPLHHLAMQNISNDEDQELR